MRDKEKHLLLALYREQQSPSGSQDFKNIAKTLACDHAQCLDIIKNMHMQGLLEIDANLELSTLGVQTAQDLQDTFEVRNTPLVISLHGIRTWGRWQETFKNIARENNIQYEPKRYGFFRADELLRAKRRQEKIAQFSQFIQDIKRSYPGQEINFIAHSMGTYMLCRALEQDHSIKLNRVILCGTFLPRKFDWSKILERNQVQAVLHQMASRDIWVRVATFFLRDGGPSGTLGFYRGDSAVKEALIEQTYHAFGHSDFFTIANMTENWAPFLKGEKATEFKTKHSGEKNPRFWATSIALLLAVLVFIHNLAPFTFFRNLACSGSDKHICQYINNRHLAQEKSREIKPLERELKYFNIDYATVSWMDSDDAHSCHTLNDIPSNNDEIHTSAYFFEVKKPKRRTITFGYRIIQHLSFVDGGWTPYGVHLIPYDEDDNTNLAAVQSSRGGSFEMEKVTYNLQTPGFWIIACAEGPARPMETHSLPRIVDLHINRLGEI